MLQVSQPMPDGRSSGAAPSLADAEREPRLPLALDDVFPHHMADRRRTRCAPEDAPRWPQECVPRPQQASRAARVVPSPCP